MRRVRTAGRNSKRGQYKPFDRLRTGPRIGWRNYQQSIELRQVIVKMVR